MTRRQCGLALPLLVLLSCTSGSCGILSTFQTALKTFEGWVHVPGPHVRPPDGPVCLDAEGQMVDWWVALKLPGSDMLAYLDSNAAHSDGADARFALIPQRCKESSGCGGSSLNRTLRQLYAVGEPGLGRPGHIMYSDAPPIVDGLNDEDFFDFSFTQGKGVLGYGGDRGFWLVHSVPSFPASPRTSAYTGIPDRQSQYAHSFMCMSASTLQLKSLSDTLRINAPYVYSEAAPESVRSGMPTSQQAAFPDLPRAVSKDPSGVNNVRVAELETLKGERFVVFAREGEQEGPDLMEGLVETYFGASMIYANPPSGLERPCSSPATGFHSLKAKTFQVEESSTAPHSKSYTWHTWDADVDKSNWAISNTALDSDAPCTTLQSRGANEFQERLSAVLSSSIKDPASKGSSAQQQKLDRLLAAAAAAAAAAQGDERVVKGASSGRSSPLWSQTMTLPVTTQSRRRLQGGLPSARGTGRIAELFWSCLTQRARSLALFLTRRIPSTSGVPSDAQVDDTSALPAVPLADVSPPALETPRVSNALESQTQSDNAMIAQEQDSPAAEAASSMPLQEVEVQETGKGDERSEMAQRGEWAGDQSDAELVERYAELAQHDANMAAITALLLEEDSKAAEVDFTDGIAATTNVPTGSDLNEVDAGGGIGEAAGSDSTESTPYQDPYTADVEDTEEEAFLAIPELGESDEEEPSTADPNLAEEKLAGLDARLQRTETALALGADPVSGGVGTSLDDRSPAALLAELQASEHAAELWQVLEEHQAPCAPATVCMHDTLRGPWAAQLPGGAVCFAGNAAMWAAFRSILRSVQPPCAA